MPKGGAHIQAQELHLFVRGDNINFYTFLCLPELFLKLDYLFLKFSIHHDSRDTSVAIGEGMHLTHHEQHEERFGKWRLQGLIILKAFEKRASDKCIIYKVCISGMVVLHLELAWRSVRTSCHHYPMPVLKYRLSCKSPWIIVKHDAWEVPLKGDLEGLLL